MTPSHTMQGLFVRSFQAAVLALGEGDQDVLERCRQVWAQHDTYVDSFYYPSRLQLEVLDVALAPLAARHGGASRVLQLLGRRCVRDFLASFIGRALLVGAGGDAKRLLTQAPEAYRIAVSSSVHSLRWLGPNHCVWTMHRDFMPMPFQEGIIQGLFEEARILNVTVLGRQLDTLEGEYDISWR
ncbi:hypothetical protein CYFUS_008739 [Cystobacter fuscus]|uniref:TIGR02265 family protein n=1 Tax=Cystobacter fuscus TaxID=43 RepID=A0A250JH95_9BACT|nr:hypothetical protein CYFUS_008739 [Cystobacter fuscus]